MWAERDHKFGGLKRRYAKHPRGESRCFDPLRQKHVSCSTELKYENWLLHWAESGISELETSCDRMQCLDHGQSVSIVPDLIVVRDGIRELQCIVRSTDKALERITRSLERVALAYGHAWALRTLDQIRANPVLLDNLERFRQCATIYVDEPLGHLRSAIEAALPNRDSLAIRDLRRILNFPLTDQSFEAALIQLHWTRHIHINFEEFRYDEAIISRRA
jgi:hypothetical protein